MTMTYTIQVSNNHDAGNRIPSDDAQRSWLTIYDGPIASATEAIAAVDGVARFYRHARVFRGSSVGKLFYAVLRTR
jgi:hypothetical protein